MRRGRQHGARRRSPAARWASRCCAAAGAAPAPRPGRLVARALLVERRALRRRADDADRNEKQARDALLDATRHPRREHPRDGRAATTASTWMPRPSAYAAELARSPRTTARRGRRSTSASSASVRTVTSRRCSPTAPRSRSRIAWPSPVRDSPKPPPERLTLTRPVINVVAAGVARARRAPTRRPRSDSLSPARATRACRPPARRAASARSSSSTRRPPSQVPAASSSTVTSRRDSISSDAWPRRSRSCCERVVEQRARPLPRCDAPSRTRGASCTARSWRARAGSPCRARRAGRSAGSR